MAKEYKVMASSFNGTYTAGRFIAESSEQACDLARQEYHRKLGRSLHDTGAFRFYTVSQFPHESDCEPEYQL